MKSAEKSDRYMTRREVAAHFKVSEAMIRQPKGTSPFALLRVVRLGDKSVRYLRSDVDKLDRWLERAAMTPYGQEPPPAPDHDYTGDEDRAA